MSETMKFTMSSSPHVAGKDSTKRIMTDVCIALLPALAAGTYFFGLYALFAVLLTVASCLFFEYLYNIIRKKPNTLPDRSAVVTGLLLGFNLPPTAPFYVPILGGLFAIIIVKMLFGGLGKNFANPAIAARIFLFVSWTVTMGRYIAPIDYSLGISAFFNFSWIFGGVDVVTSATPLSGSGSSLLNMFLGNTAGCIGETSSLALLLGGIYLTVRKVIDVRIPLLILLSAAVTTLVFGGGIFSVLPALFSGGLMLGCIFMATDYSSSPNTTWGIVIFSVFIGFMTILFRTYSHMPEGMSFAILLGNLFVPLLDRYIIPKPFGHVWKRRKKV